MDSLTPEDPDTGDSQRLSVVAYGALLDMILRGAIVAGEMVTERQIAARLGISRTPVREAVRRLEGEGTLERQRNGALVVRPYSLEDFLHALAVRRLLEGEGRPGWRPAGSGRTYCRPRANAPSACAPRA